MKFLNGITVALVGYTKAASASAISATDTILQAIGKLEATGAHYMQIGFACPNDDANDCITTGTYYFTPSTDNIPVADRYGIIVVFVSPGITYNGSSNWLFQEVILVNFPAVKYTRQKINDGAWTAWQTWTA